MKPVIAACQKFWQKQIKKTTSDFRLLLAIAACLVIVIVQPAIATRQYPQATANKQPAMTIIAQSSGGMHLKGNRALLEQGSRLYTEGKLIEAVTAWQKALQIYRDRQGSDAERATAQLNEALCLSYLSLAYQDLGEWQQAETAIAQSSDILSKQSLTTREAKAITARVSNTKGSLQLAMGQPQTALESWKIAADQYTQLGDEIGQLGSQTNQAQALQALGLFRQASEQIEAIELRLEKQPDSLLKAIALRSLGTTLQSLGDLAKSQKILEQSLAIAKQLNNPSETSATLLSLGNNYRFLQKSDLALQNYEQAAVLAPDYLLRLEAQAVQLSLLVEKELYRESEILWQQIEPQFDNLKPSRRSIYLRVNVTDSLIKINNRVAVSAYSSKVANQLAIAVRQAQEIQDRRAESFATGELGILYEQNKQLPDAYKLAQRALVLAQATNADDLLYRWQWLSGKVLEQQGEYDRAIAAYSQSVQNIQILRRELVATAPEVQFAFRDRIEPIYRELVGLLLRNEQPSQENLKQARLTLESLQVVELENYFRSACLDVKPQQIDAIDSNSAAIYSAVLSDRLAVILSVPNAPLRYHATAIPQAEVEQTADLFLQSLNPAFSDRDRFQISQKLFDWIIRPNETFLTERKIKNLVVHHVNFTGFYRRI